MAYQLRFQKSLPLNVWMKETAYQLEPLLSASPAPSADPRRSHRVRRALARGLSSFLTKRSLCDVDEDCDWGLARAPENTFSRGPEDGLFSRSVTRYIFKKGSDLPGAIQKTIDALAAEFPDSAGNAGEIAGLLKKRISPHLFENPECLRRDICRHSYALDLGRDMGMAPPHCPIPAAKNH